MGEWGHFWERGVKILFLVMLGVGEMLEDGDGVGLK